MSIIIETPSSETELFFDHPAYDYDVLTEDDGMIIRSVHKGSKSVTIRQISNQWIMDTQVDYNGEDLEDGNDNPSGQQ